MSIPKTTKERIFQGNQTINIYTHSFSNTTKGNYTHTYTNPNVYAVPVVISAQAGSGDINNTAYQPTEGAKYYNAGRQGHNLTIKLNSVAILTLSGGAGSVGGALAGERDWRGNTKGWSSWRNYANSKQVAQNGQTGSMVITLPPNGKLEFVYTYNSASNSAHLGSHTISAVYWAVLCG